MKPAIFKILLLALVIPVLTLGGCSKKQCIPPKPAVIAAKSEKQPDRQKGSPAKKKVPSKLLTTGEDRILKELDALFRKWKGTPYKYSGKSRSGIDCSGFTQIVYRDVFSRKLPRMVRDQIKTGRKIKKSQLRPGDLIFFRTGKKTKHVGVYTHSDNFIHASSQQGVSTSSLSNSYWQDRYLLSRTFYTP